MNVRMKKLLMFGVIATGLIMATAVVSRSLVSELGTSKISPVVVAQSQNATQDEQQITKAAMGYLTQKVAREYPPGVDPSPLPPVKIDAITLVRPYAIVEFFWGGMWGQVLLLKKAAVWQVVSAEYGALTSSYLAKAGVPANTAQALVKLHQEQSKGSTILGKNVPQGLKACIPTRQVASVELAGTTKKAGTTYYLLAAYPEIDTISADLLISANQQDQCSLLFYNPWGEIPSLGQFAPIDVVRSLALQRLKRKVDKAGGKVAYQQLLNSGVDLGVPPPTRETPEEVWALQQLGIQIRALPQSGQ